MSRAAQQEAADKLTIAAHLTRDPGLMEMLRPIMDAQFGLACLSLRPEGLKDIAETAGRDVATVEGIVTRDTIIETLRGVFRDSGASAALDSAHGLWRLGFEAARREGGSIGPFLGASVSIPDPPRDDNLDQWQAYQQEIHAIVAAWRAYDDQDFGAVSLLCHCGARANIHQLAQLIAPAGPVRDVDRRVVHVRHSWQSGLTPDEAMARVAGARRGLFEMHERLDEIGRGQEARERPEGHGVLSRARRAQRPGVVFARAAAAGEIDPLTDQYARLFVGISD